MKTFHFILMLILSELLLEMLPANSENIFLKCTGKYEINRGELIKPDWETSHLTINLNGFGSSIEDKGINKKGITSIGRDSYTIIHRDKSNRITSKYKVNRTYGNYTVTYPQLGKKLIGTCQKGRG